METWIAVTRDLYHLTGSNPVWQIQDFPILNGDTIADVMKATCGELGLPRDKVSTHLLRYGGATELAASGLPQYIIAAYGGWIQDSRAIRVYTRLSLSTNAMVSTRMSQAASSRSAQMVVNDILMHRIAPQDCHPASDSSASTTEESRQKTWPTIVLTRNLGLSKLSCAFTGEHAERSASRSWCLKSRSVFYWCCVFNCVFSL
jgi:hypothetical protein